MAGKHNFADLKQHATKEYKFQQGKSIAALDPNREVHGNAINAVQLSDDEFDGIKGGVCASLAANWLREKLTSAKHPVFSGASGGAAVHTGVNLATVGANVPKFLAYRKNPTTSRILAQHGLEASDKTTFLQPVLSRQETIEVKSYISGTGRFEFRKGTQAVPMVAESLANACSVNFLEKGRGFYFGFSVESKVPEKKGGGHAVAAYRSRGNTLYFFDPNCGVYNVSAVAEFFAAYVGCYDKLGYRLAINSNRNDGFTYVDR